MLSSRLIATTLFSISISNPTLACWDTLIKYEISRECEVNILSIESESRFPKKASDWHSYLQSEEASAAGQYEGIPLSARKIFRSGSDSLYCEFDAAGKVLEAYTMPSMWLESERRWIVMEKKLIPVFDGLLSSKEYHESIVTTCL